MTTVICSNATVKEPNRLFNENFELILLYKFIFLRLIYCCCNSVLFRAIIQTLYCSFRKFLTGGSVCLIEFFYINDSRI